MKMKFLLAGLLAIWSFNIMGQDRCDQDTESREWQLLYK